MFDFLLRDAATEESQQALADMEHLIEDGIAIHPDASPSLK